MCGKKVTFLLEHNLFNYNLGRLKCKSSCIIIVLCICAVFMKSDFKVILNMWIYNICKLELLILNLIQTACDNNMEKLFVMSF